MVFIVKFFINAFCIGINGFVVPICIVLDWIEKLEIPTKLCPLPIP
jgi:hypothetical protein